MASGDIARSIREFLRRRGEPASSLLLANRFLKLAPTSEEIATRVLDPLLRMEGLVYAADSGWRAQDRRPPGRVVACAVEIDPRAHGLVPVVRGTEGRSAAIRSLCLIESPHEAPANDREAPGGRGRISEPDVEGLDWIAVSGFLEGAEAVFMSPRVESPPLIGELARQGLPGPAKIRSLAESIRGSVRIPRGAGAEEICGALGCAHREGHTASDAAENIAACLEAAAARRAGRTPRTPASSAGPLTPSFLSSVPERPGVYRFYDDKDRLLYVGKAADLRRRLSSHRARPVHAGVHRVEIEVLGSDLEALLKEARLIAARAPRANVQREVHERGRAYAPGRAQALLLPAKDPGTLAVVLVQDGGYAGWVRLGPRGGGEKEAKRILRRILGARAAGRPRGEGRPPSPESEILNSWLARHGERVSRVDLDSCRGPASALRLLRRAMIEAGDDGPFPAIRRQGASTPRAPRGWLRPPRPV
jgi:GIY-YIG catalytic domain-containing protein